MRKLEVKDGAIMVEMSPDELVSFLSTRLVSSADTVSAHIPASPDKCRYCEKRVVPGKRVCAKHLKGLRAGAAKARAARKKKS